MFEGYNVRNNVLFGDDDKLFLFQGAHEQFSYLCGNKEVSRSSIIEFNSNITRRRKFCLDSGIDYLHVIFPCKPVVYKKNFQGLPIRSIYSNEHERECVLYPLSDLDFDTSYYKYDTHCSPRGSWECLMAIFRELHFEHQEEALFKEEVRLSGDLAVMIDETDREEHIEVFSGLKSRNIRSIREVSNQAVIKRNNGIIKILSNSYPVFDKRLLVFGDSFFGGHLLTMLSEFFKEVIYIRTPYFQSDIIPFIQPDVVFTGQAERYITSGLSDSNILPFFSEYVFSGCDIRQFDDNFNKALKAMLSPKDGPLYKHWRNSFVGNSLRNKAVSLRKENLGLAFELINLANESLKNNDKIGLILDSIKKEYESSVNN